jgi:hypothetical protein
MTKDGHVTHNFGFKYKFYGCTERDADKQLWIIGKYFFTKVID